MGFHGSRRRAGRAARAIRSFPPLNDGAIKCFIVCQHQYSHCSGSLLSPSSCSKSRHAKHKKRRDVSRFLFSFLSFFVHASVCLVPLPSSSSSSIPARKKPHQLEEQSLSICSQNEPHYAPEVVPALPRRGRGGEQRGGERTHHERNAASITAYPVCCETSSHQKMTRFFAKIENVRYLQGTDGGFPLFLFEGF